jgi:N-acetylglucosaminyldiphosphoundecaprenol N-acetyl-beta-D-mannosaminyltransferase
MTRLRIGRIWIDAVTFQEALDGIASLVRTGEGGLVCTPNIDHVVNAETDDALWKAYCSASFSFVDGQPLVWASHLLRPVLPAKISGSDLVPALLERAARESWRVYLLGGGPGAAAIAAERIRQAPGVNVVGVDAPMIALQPSREEGAVIDRIREAAPDLLLVGLGSPKQEVFIHRARARLPRTVAIGVGASLDFLAGRVRRAPSWVSRAGLEWLFRLVQEPRRLARRYLWNDLRFVGIFLRTFVEARRAPRLTQDATEALGFDPASGRAGGRDRS